MHPGHEDSPSHPGPGLRTHSRPQQSCSPPATAQLAALCLSPGSAGPAFRRAAGPTLRRPPGQWEAVWVEGKPRTEWQGRLPPPAQPCRCFPLQGSCACTCSALAQLLIRLPCHTVSGQTLSPHGTCSSPSTPHSHCPGYDLSLQPACGTWERGLSPFPWHLAPHMTPGRAGTDLFIRGVF